MSVLHLQPMPTCGDTDPYTPGSQTYYCDPQKALCELLQPQAAASCISGLQQHHANNTTMYLWVFNNKKLRALDGSHMLCSTRTAAAHVCYKPSADDH
jgi:hypothetical protein